MWTGSCSLSMWTGWWWWLAHLAHGDHEARAADVGPRLAPKEELVRGIVAARQPHDLGHRVVADHVGEVHERHPTVRVVVERGLVAILQVRLERALELRRGELALLPFEFDPHHLPSSCWAVMYWGGGGGGGGGGDRGDGDRGDGDRGDGDRGGGDRGPVAPRFSLASNRWGSWGVVDVPCGGAPRPP